MTKSRHIPTYRTARGLHAHWLYWAMREREAAQLSERRGAAYSFKQSARDAMRQAVAVRTATADSPAWHKLPD